MEKKKGGITFIRKNGRLIPIRKKSGSKDSGKSKLVTRNGTLTNAGRKKTNTKKTIKKLEQTSKKARQKQKEFGKQQRKGFAKGFTAVASVGIANAFLGALIRGKTKGLLGKSILKTGRVLNGNRGTTLSLGALLGGGVVSLVSTTKKQKRENSNAIETEASANAISRALRLQLSKKRKKKK